MGYSSCNSDKKEREPEALERPRRINFIKYFCTFKYKSKSGKTIYVYEQMD